MKIYVLITKGQDIEDAPRCAGPTDRNGPGDTGLFNAALLSTGSWNPLLSQVGTYSTISSQFDS